MFFFGWWAKRQLRLKEQELRECMYQNLSFLFRELGAKFVPNEKYRSQFGLVHATLEVGHLRLRAVSMRDGSYVEVAAAHSPEKWEEIGLVLAAVRSMERVGPADDISRHPTFLPLSVLRPLLKKHFAELQEALSEANYATTWQAIQRIKQVEGREYYQDMKNRVQFYRDHPNADRWNRKQNRNLGLNRPRA
jgi:hypothetical protein